MGTCRLSCTAHRRLTVPPDAASSRSKTGAGARSPNSTLVEDDPEHAHPTAVVASRSPLSPSQARVWHQPQASVEAAIYASAACVDLQPCTAALLHRCTAAPLWPSLAPNCLSVAGAMSRLWCHWSLALALERGSKGERHMAHGPPVCTSEPSAGGATPQPQSALSKLPTHAVIPCVCMYCMYRDPAPSLTLYFACTPTRHPPSTQFTGRASM